MGVSDVAMYTVVPAIGAVVSFCMYASPIPAVMKAEKRMEIGELNPVPFAATLALTIAWTSYGLIIADGYVTAPNAIGILFAMYQTLTSHGLADREIKNRIRILVCISSFLFPVLGILSVFACSSDECLKDLWGYSSDAITIIYYAAPMTTMVAVIKTRNAKSILLPLAIANLCNALLWTSYGFAIVDGFLIVPNGIGCILSALMLSLKCVYPSIHETTPERKSLANNMADSGAPSDQAFSPMDGPPTIKSEGNVAVPPHAGIALTDTAPYSRAAPYKSNTPMSVPLNDLESNNAGLPAPSDDGAGPGPYNAPMPVSYPSATTATDAPDFNKPGAGAYRSAYHAPAPPAESPNPGPYTSPMPLSTNNAPPPNNRASPGPYTSPNPLSTNNTPPPDNRAGLGPYTSPMPVPYPSTATAAPASDPTRVGTGAYHGGGLQPQQVGTDAPMAVAYNPNSHAMDDVDLGTGYTGSPATHDGNGMMVPQAGMHTVAVSEAGAHRRHPSGGPGQHGQGGASGPDSAV